MDKKIIVRVDASFEQGAALFTWLTKYAKQADKDFAYWDEFAFTAADLPECDAVLIFNTPSEKIDTLCFPENVLAFMMEPGIYDEHPWMFKGLQQYAAVYSPLKNADNIILSPGFLGWHVQQNWQQLSGLAVPEKQLDISCIASSLSLLKGHRRRLQFVKTLQKEISAIDFFGKGNHYIPDKMEGLLPYRFSIAIENTSVPYYFTEKITDCFLACTVPLYYGCKNIGSYFPERSFIQINIEEPENAINKIRQIIEKDDWHARAGALQEARDLVLNKYQPLAGAACMLRQIKPSVKSNVLLKPVPPTFTKKIRSLLHRAAAKK